MTPKPIKRLDLSAPVTRIAAEALAHGRLAEQIAAHAARHLALDNSRRLGHETAINAHVAAMVQGAGRDETGEFLASLMVDWGMLEPFPPSPE